MIMEEEVLVKRHNFDLAKQNIEQFSRNLPADPKFVKVEEEIGIFGWRDHKVTGRELNRFQDEVQNKLISVNSTLKNVICEFREVYKAFDSLDSEYIKGIIGSVESAQKASEQALKAQSDLNCTVENLKKTVDKLSSIKSDVDRISSQVESLTKMGETKIGNDYSLPDIKSVPEHDDDVPKNFDKDKKLADKRFTILFWLVGFTFSLSVCQLILQLFNVI